GAVVAEALAEGDMDIGRQGLGGRPVAAFGGLPVVVLGEGLAELGRGGVGGVARPRAVVFLYQRAVEAQWTGHGQCFQRSLMHRRIPPGDGWRERTGRLTAGLRANLIMVKLHSAF